MSSDIVDEFSFHGFTTSSKKVSNLSWPTFVVVVVPP